MESGGGPMMIDMAGWLSSCRRDYVSFVRGWCH